MKYRECERCLFREEGSTYCPHCTDASQFEPDFDAGQPEDDADDFDGRPVIRLEIE